MLTAIRQAVGDEVELRVDAGQGWTAKQAVEYLNILLMKTGGINQALQIANMAEITVGECMIGSMMESSVGVSAAVHLVLVHSIIILILRYLKNLFP